MNSRKEARNAALGIGLSHVAPGRQLAHANSEAGAPTSAEPIKGAQPEPRPRMVSGAVGAVSRTLDQFQHELQTAKDLAAAGSRVLELDPADIEDSILKDRLEIDEVRQSSLVESIRQSGQQVAVLVRRIADSPARYQVAYGHRRVDACRRLGRKVLAVVRDLSDQELLVAQGQENSARTDLSFIERAVFALHLEQRGIPRDAIMSALTTDKTELSKMISVARSVPDSLVRAIGPAPKAGRTRWLGLSQRLAEVHPDARLQSFLHEEAFRSASSDARFEQVFKFLHATPKRGEERLRWATTDGKEVVRGVRSRRALVLTIDERKEPGFGAYLFENLEAFHQAFRSGKRPR